VVTHAGGRLTTRVLEPSSPIDSPDNAWWTLEPQRHGGTGEDMTADVRLATEAEVHTAQVDEPI
jgi:hypothetical protein